ncbi:LemA family protein [Candidatus Dependentiae bacterium]
MFLIVMGIIVIVALFSFILWSLSAYNRLVRLDALAYEGWSGINMQLKRRCDLIPSLVAVFKQYGVGEGEILEEVIEIRLYSADAKNMKEKIEAESGLSEALKTLFDFAKSYPELSEDENFLSLQKDLGEIEKELQLARGYYNEAAKNYNTAISKFPSNIVAKFFGFLKKPYLK